jgi:hypothetical protein
LWTGCGGAALNVVRGIRPGHIPADPIRELHLQTLKAMGERSDSPARINLMGGDQWPNQRKVERGLLAGILATECPMLADVEPLTDNTYTCPGGSKRD